MKYVLNTNYGKKIQHSSILQESIKCFGIKSESYIRPWFHA